MAEQHKDKHELTGILRSFHSAEASTLVDKVMTQGRLGKERFVDNRPAYKSPRKKEIPNYQIIMSTQEGLEAITFAYDMQPPEFRRIREAINAEETVIFSEHYNKQTGSITYGLEIDIDTPISNYETSKRSGWHFTTTLVNPKDPPKNLVK